MKKIVPIEFWIENEFDSSGKISDMIYNLFELDEESFIILGVIAEKGLLTSFQIEKYGYKKSHEITRDKIRSRLPGILQDFLIEKKGNKRRNTGRTHKFYHLTFKGLIASLCKTPFEENHVVKKYLKFLELYADKFYIPEIILQLMKYNLALYLIKNVGDGLKLTHLNNIDDKIFKLNSHESQTEPSLRQKPISDKKLEKDEFEIRTRLHIIRQILNQSIKNVSLEHMSNITRHQKEEKNPIDSFILNILPDYIQYWFDYIQEIQFEEIDTMEPNIRLENRNLHGIKLDIKTANKKSLDILKKLGINAKLTETDEPPLFL